MCLAMIKMFRNVVRGFSLVLHDPEGSHYKGGRHCERSVAISEKSPLP